MKQNGLKIGKQNWNPQYSENRKYALLDMVQYDNKKLDVPTYVHHTIKKETI